jgi:hypothetical protein
MRFGIAVSRLTALLGAAAAASALLLAPAGAAVSRGPDTIASPADVTANCIITHHNPDTRAWVHVDKATGHVQIRMHGHMYCQIIPWHIYFKLHLQKYVFPPSGEPVTAGHWKEIAATQIYYGLNPRTHVRYIPAHSHSWHPGRWRSAFEFWGYSRRSHTFGKGYFCSDNLDIPRGPAAVIARALARSIIIHPDTHRCFPPPV